MAPLGAATIRESGVRVPPRRHSEHRPTAESTDSNSVQCGFESHCSDHSGGDGAGWICTRLSAETKRDRNPSSPPEWAASEMGSRLVCTQPFGVRIPGGPPIPSLSVNGRLTGSQSVNEGSNPSSDTRLLRALPWGWLGLITRCPIGFESLARYQYRVRPTAGPRSYKPMTGVRIPHPVPISTVGEGKRCAARP